jgi:hypothetical protein
MTEPQAFSIFFSVILILIGLPLLLFGILQYSSSPPEIGVGILGIGAFMLILGTFFLIIILTQKST